jgi:hypothetical protein
MRDDGREWPGKDWLSWCPAARAVPQARSRGERPREFACGDLPRFVVGGLLPRYTLRPMTAFRCSASIFSLLAGVAVLFASTQPSGKPQNAEQEVRQLNTQEVQAFLQKDPKELARLWSDDFVVTNPLNKFVTNPGHSPLLFPRMCRKVDSLHLDRARRASFSFIRAFTSFFTSAAGRGLSIGNWIVPFEVR